MAYTISFTDAANKGQITVEDGTVNTETSIGFPGRNTTSYGAVVAENFLHLLENFADTTAPLNPVEGQLWYDTRNGQEQLTVYDGTNWVPASGVIRAETAPLVAQRGDLWVDKDNQQLYLYTGAGWVLVGPGFSEGLSTGTIPVKIVGKDNVEYTVLQIEVGAEIVAIISNDTFEPKGNIAGFSIINPGINVRTTGINKFYGTAEKAESLVIGTDEIPAGTVFRTNRENTASEPLNIQNDQGINIGVNGEITLGVEGQAAIVQHNIDGSSIDFRVRLNEATNTVMRLDSSRRVGINTLAPEEALDVAGNVVSSGTLRVNSTANSFDTNTGAISTLGGLAVKLDSNLGGALTVQGTTTTADIIPDTADTGTNRTIGSPGAQYFSMYASRFVGDLEGNVSGGLNGTATQADALTRRTRIAIRGDVSSEYDIQFDGAFQDPDGYSPDSIQTPTGELPYTKTIVTSISNQFIANKLKAPDSEAFEDDELLINVVGGRISDTEEQGLRKVTKKEFLADVPITPVGAILPYAGTAAPAGWFLCDGSEVDRDKYEALERIIGYTYKPRTLLTGTNTFAIPDLRGRLPLGKDDMDNDFTDGFGGEAGRVTGGEEEYPVVLGGTGGTEYKKILIENLPDHIHDLIGEDGQFFAIQAELGAPTSPAESYPGLGGSAGASKALPNSGGILTDAPSLGTDFGIMPPTITLNYIIYHGVTE